MDAKVKELLKPVDENYAKIPALPKGATDFIASVAPWLALIFGVLAVLFGLFAIVGMLALSPVAALSGVGQYAVVGLVAAVILVLQGGMELLAYPSLKARKAKGWNLMFYVLVLSFVSSLFSLNVMSVVSSLVGVLIGYYFLYQVKSYYK